MVAQYGSPEKIIEELIETHGLRPLHFYDMFETIEASSTAASSSKKRIRSKSDEPHSKKHVKKKSRSKGTVVGKEILKDRKFHDKEILCSMIMKEYFDAVPRVWSQSLRDNDELN